MFGLSGPISGAFRGILRVSGLFGRILGALGVISKGFCLSGCIFGGVFEGISGSFWVISED